MLKCFILNLNLKGFLYIYTYNINYSFFFFTLLHIHLIISCQLAIVTQIIYAVQSIVVVAGNDVRTIRN